MNDTSFSPYSIRVVEFLPHAVVGANNTLANASSEPKNPALRLELNTPDGMQQRTAFAKFPDFQSMHGGSTATDMKVTFLYAGGAGGLAHDTPPIQLYSIPDGDLHARFSSIGAKPSDKPVNLQQPIASPWGDKMLTVFICHYSAV